MVEAQKVLNDPDAYDLSLVLAALEKQEDDVARNWLEEHPDQYDRVLEGFRSFSETLHDLAVMVQGNDGLEYSLDEGVYQNAFIAKDGEGLRFSQAYFWSKTMEGYILVDVHHSELPDVDEIEGLNFGINSSDGVPLIFGTIVDIGRVDGIGGCTTLVIEPAERT